MYCVRKVSDDLWWVGGNDRRLAMFEDIIARNVRKCKFSDKDSYYYFIG